MTTFLRLLCIPLCGLIFTGCIKFFSPDLAQKHATLKIHEPQWQPRQSIAIYGKSRSQQLFELDQLAVSSKGFHYSGSNGMAVAITKDGYALTAYHVIDQKKPYGILTGPDLSNRVHVVTPLMVLTRKGETNPHRVVALEERVAAYPDLTLFNSMTLAQRKQKLTPLKTLPIRIVHRFPGRDLALIKLPVSGPNIFPIAASLSKDEVLFTPGNGIAEIPSGSAGRAIGPLTAGRYVVSVPGSKGESGGAMLNRKGELVGVNIEARAAPIFSKSFVRHMVIELLDKKQIFNLIKVDRTK